MDVGLDKRIPALRFKDNQGKDYPEWKEMEFSKLVDRVTESHRPSKNEIVPCIELENLGSGNGILLGVSTTANQKSMKTRFMSGDVLFGKLRPYLRKFHLAKFDGVCTTEIWVFRAKTVKSKYLYFVVQSDQFFRVANFQFGTKMPRSDWRVVSRLKIQLPSSGQEQQKIATFLSSVDLRIEQLEKKKSLLERYKKGLMQKLFSQELRFKDDQGEEHPEWELRKLGEISASYSGGTPTSTNRNYYGGDIPLIKSGEISSSTTEESITNEALNNSSAKRVNKGDILYALYGATSGEVAISKIDGAINQAVLCIRPQFDNQFLFQILKFKKKKIISAYLQGGQGNLSATIVKALKVHFPSIEEQQKIADFLSSIDAKIEYTAAQIMQTREFKKGLLQQMFV